MVERRLKEKSWRGLETEDRRKRLNGRRKKTAEWRQTSKGKTKEPGERKLKTEERRLKKTEEISCEVEIPEEQTEEERACNLSSTN